MIAILINGEELQIPIQEINTSYKSFRFADAIRDQFTTDIEIPLTEDNARILKLYAVQDGGRDFSQPIACSITSNGTTTDGTIHIISIKDNTATASVFFNTLPYSVFDKTIREIVPDTEATIFPWSRYSRDTYNTGHTDDCELSSYNYGFAFNGRFAQHHATMRVDKMMEAIGEAIGVEMPKPDGGSSYDCNRIIATCKNLSPYAPQTLAMYKFVDDQEVTHNVIAGSRHVLNDCEGAYWSDNELQVVTFNRRCTAEITYYSIDGAAVYINGEMADANYNAGLSHRVFTTQFGEGDTLTFTAIPGAHTEVNNYASVVALVKYSDYDISADDYGEELAYVEEPPHLMRFGTQEYIFNGNSGLPHWPFSWFGYWANLPEVNLKKLLNSFVWFTGQKLIVNGKTITMADADERKSVEGVVTEIQTTCDSLGQINEIRWAEDTEPIITTIDNCYLEDRKTIHESVFRKVCNWHNAASIPQYNYEIDYDDDGVATYRVSFEEVGCVIAQETHNEAGHYWMRPPHDLNTMGVDALRRSLLAVIETLDNVKGCDYIYIDGIKYMVVSYDTDANNGITTLNALVMNNC